MRLEILGENYNWIWKAFDRDRVGDDFFAPKAIPLGYVPWPNIQIRPVFQRLKMERD